MEDFDDPLRFLKKRKITGSNNGPYEHVIQQEQPQVEQKGTSEETKEDLLRFCRPRKKGVETKGVETKNDDLQRQEEKTCKTVPIHTQEVISSSPLYGPPIYSSTIREKKVDQNIVVRPKNPFLEDLDQDDAYGKVQLWFKSETYRPLLLIGPSGCGKTSLLEHFIPKDFILHTYDVDDTLEDLLMGHSFQKRVILFDLIETLDTSERQFIGKHIKQFKKKVIFTSNDSFCAPTKTWTSSCVVAKMNAPSERFIKQVLDLHFAGYQGNSQIAKVCNRNLASAYFQAEFNSKKKHANASSNSISSMDLFYDTPKLVPRFLRHELLDSTIGGTNDIIELTGFLQTMTPMMPKLTTSQLQILDDYAFLDIVSSAHELDHEQLWTLLTTTIQSGPKGQCTFTWPKYVRPLEKPTMGHNFI